MIEVFKTNVETKEESEIILSLLLSIFPSYKMNFDLDDCDRILRAQGEYIFSDKIIKVLFERGHHCEILAE